MGDTWISVVSWPLLFMYQCVLLVRGKIWNIVWLSETKWMPNVMLGATFNKHLVQLPACRRTILYEVFRDFLLYSSPNIVGNKSRRMRLAGHVPHIGRAEMRTGFWCGKLKKTN
jgi:hypothetical protein